MPEWLQEVLTFLAGIATGILSGMFGIGGAVISNPALRAIGAPPIVAVGSTLPSIIPGAISGSLRYRREGLVRARVVGMVALPGMAAAVGGALLSKLVPEPRLLTMAVGVLALFTAVQTARDARTPREPIPAEGDAEAIVEVAPAPRVEATWRLVTIGLAAGLMSGLLGVGGGILMVPLFLTWVHLPLKEAVANSLACVGILAIPGAITHTILGHIDWSFAIPLALGIIPGARIGASLAIRSTERRLRVLVALVLGTVSISYVVTELVGMLR